MIRGYINELRNVLDSLDHVKVEGLVQRIMQTHSGGNTVYIAGNGGSAVNASHWACDLTKGTLNGLYEQRERRLRVISLTDNIATLTALANDVSYEEVFSQQLRSLSRKGDLLISLSGSGNSKNILRGLETATELDLYSFSLLGFGGGRAAQISDETIIVESSNYGIVEDVHLTIGHLVTSRLREELKHLSS